MSWVELSLYHAAVGRGYWLVILLSVLLFTALLVLLDPPRSSLNQQRLAWVALVAATVLGTYTVPTFAYAVGSAYSWLWLQAVRGRQWRLVGWVVLVGLGAVVGTGLLYAPTLYVSGLAALLANPYVKPLGVGAFVRELPTHAWFAEGYLVGQRSIGAGGTLLGLGLFGLLVRHRRMGRLAPALARQVQQVGLPALWFVLFPYLLAAAQRVLPPERTWLYKSWFFMLLVSLVLTGCRLVRRELLAVGLGVFVLYQVGGRMRLNYLAPLLDTPHLAAYEWLQRHPAAGPVLISDISLWNWLRLKTHVETPLQRWQPDYQPRPGITYTYTITWHGAPRPAGRVVLTAGELFITQLTHPITTATPAQLL